MHSAKYKNVLQYIVDELVAAVKEVRSEVVKGRKVALMCALRVVRLLIYCIQ